MQITVTGRHMEITDAIRAYVQQKFEKLPRYFDRIQQVRVVAQSRDQVNKHVEAIVHVDHHEPFVASEAAEDLYGCIDDVFNKMERQLHDHKQRLRNRKHTASPS